MSLARIYPKNKGDRSVMMADHAVFIAGVSPDETSAVFFKLSTLGSLYTADGGAVGSDGTSSRGVAGARFSSADQSGAVASVTDAPASGKRLVITDLLLSSDTDLRLDFTIESSATVIESFYVPAGTSMQFTPRGKWKLATADKKLQVKASGAGNIGVTAFYYSE